MADSEGDVRQAEMERDSLQKTISDVEAAIGASTPGTRSVFQVFLLNARGRLETVEKKIKESKAEIETRAREQVALTSLAEKETALNAKEKETYNGFLKEDFFTKRDFGRLEQFYTKTWDRLSEQGKDEMSKRVWGGVRHGEYRFDQLPPKVREKETERAYQVLRERESGVGNSLTIPETDSHDFIRAYESGDRKGAGKILERDSFKEGLFKERESAAKKHVELDSQKEADKAVALAKLDSALDGRKSQKAPQDMKNGARDLVASGLEGVKLADADKQGTSADMPSARKAGESQLQSSRGG